MRPLPPPASALITCRALSRLPSVSFASQQPRAAPSRQSSCGQRHHFPSRFARTEQQVHTHAEQQTGRRDRRERRRPTYPAFHHACLLHHTLTRSILDVAFKTALLWKDRFLAAEADLTQATVQVACVCLHPSACCSAVQATAFAQASQPLTHFTHFFFHAQAARHAHEARLAQRSLQQATSSNTENQGRCAECSLCALGCYQRRSSISLSLQSNQMHMSAHSYPLIQHTCKQPFSERHSHEQTQQRPSWSKSQKSGC